MSNTNAPYGFMPVGLLSGGPADFGFTQLKIRSASTTAVYSGDILSQESGHAGYFTVTAPGTEVIRGIAIGFKWLSASAGTTVYRQYWPGNGDAVGDVTVDVVQNPNAIFQVQGGSTVYTQADIGDLVQNATGTGNTANGRSGAYITGASANTTTYPFRLESIVGTPNSDPASAYQTLIVSFNNQTFKQLAQA